MSKEENQTQDQAPPIEQIAPMAPPVVQVSVQPAPPVQPQNSETTNGLAIASMITGILGLLGAWAFFGGLPAIAAVILGIIALKKPGGKGMAITGIVTGGLGIVGFLIVLFIYFLAILASSV